MTSVGAPHSDSVKTCQVGYLPDETKYAVVTTEASGEAVVRRARDGREVLRVKLGPERLDADSGDRTRSVDFSALKTPGEYVLDIAGVGQSHPFRVGRDIFSRPLRLAMRSFTGQRCGIAVDLGPDFPQYKYDACHTAPSPYHASAGKTGIRDVTGGWHDAGDYGKYVVNSGITTGTLLWAFELYGPKLAKLKLDLPDSKRNVPDFLTEVKWNLDWMLKMQDEDGGVWHKATTASFPGFVMPKNDPTPVLVIGAGREPYKNTTATADLAAVAAIAARVYRPYDRAYADRCLGAARKAWAWVEKHPDVLYQRNPQGVGTGGYGDSDASDERLWAAAELFRATGEAAFNDYFKANAGKWSPTLKGDSPMGWPAVSNLAMYTYALSGRREADRKLVATIKGDAKAAATAIADRIDANGYRMPLKSQEYYWGSNSVVTNYAIMLLLADRWETNRRFRNAALDSLHYLLGRNAFNTSFVTHVGTKWAMNPHHRPSGADGIEQPWPGLLVGGPNADGKTPPAKQWLDRTESYTTNENAINWNAPLVFVLAAVR
jgi:endoglucanase